MARYNEDLEYLIRDVDISKDELNDILVEADKIISDTNSEENRRIEAYLKKVQCLQKLDKYAESKEFIDKLLCLNPDMPEALARLGNFYSENKDYVNAIDYVTKAIKLKNNYAYAYCVRGNIYRDNGEKDNALQDYSTAIYYKSDYIAVYNNRGLVKYDLLDYQSAIEDYDKALENNPRYAVAYYNRGLARCDLNDWPNAIRDYDKAIENNSEYAEAYYNRGFAKFSMSGITDSINIIKDFSDAIKNNPSDVDAYHNRGVVYAMTKKRKEAAEDFRSAGEYILSLLVTEDEELIDYTFNYEDFFIKATENFKNGEIEDYRNIYVKSLKITSKLHIKDKNELEMFVSHYTKRDISEKLLFGKSLKKNNARNYFRLNSMNTSNDPEEGKTLFRYLFPKEDYSSEVEEFGAFAGCFILNGDGLNQFRLYGKTKDKEGTGVSISLNKSFFSEDMSRNIEMKPNSSNKNERVLSKKLPLFRCIYIDPETDEIISLGQREEYVFYREDKSKKNYQKYKTKINKTQKEISNELEELKKLIEIRKLNHNVVYKLLLDLRYLVKHVAFKY